MAYLFQRWVLVCLSLCASLVTATTNHTTPPGTQPPATLSTSTTVTPIILPSLPTNLIPTDLIPSDLPTGANSQTTCSALQRIANTSTYCSTIDTCTQVRCSALGVNTDVGVVPCNNPPAVTIVTYGVDGNNILNRTITQSQEIPINLGSIPLMTLNVTVIPEEDAIILKIDAVVSSTGTILPLVPETTIPIDRSNCPGHNHTHGTMHPDGETTSPDGETTSPDGETTSPDGETTFPDDGTTPAGGGTTPPSNTTGLITSNGISIVVLVVALIAVVSLAAIVIVVVVIIAAVLYRQKKLRAYSFQRMAFNEVNNEEVNNEEDE